MSNEQVGTEAAHAHYSLFTNHFRNQGDIRPARRRARSTSSGSNVARARTDRTVEDMAPRVLAVLDGAAKGHVAELVFRAVTE